MRDKNMKNEMNVDFKYVEIPYGEDALALLGSEWIREYGVDDKGKAISRNHFHNLMEIGICRWGSGEIVFDKKRYPYKKGDITVVPKNYPHATVNEQGEKSFWEYIYIKPSVFLEKIYKSEVRKREKFTEEVEYRPFIKGQDEVPGLVAEINLIMDQLRIREYEYRNCIKGLLFALIMEIIKINHIDSEKPEYDEKYSPRKVKTMGKALEFIEENYAKDLRISDIAEASFVSETYLRRLFAECCAISPMQYVKLIRIDAACKLIKSTDANINEIAYKVGFTNMATFINNFKQIVGCTPKQWKQKMKQSDKKM